MIKLHDNSIFNDGFVELNVVTSTSGPLNSFYTNYYENSNFKTLKYLIQMNCLCVKIREDFV